MLARDADLGANQRELFTGVEPASPAFGWRSTIELKKLSCKSWVALPKGNCLARSVQLVGRSLRSQMPIVYRHTLTEQCPLYNLLKPCTVTNVTSFSAECHGGGLPNKAPNSPEVSTLAKDFT